MKARSVDVERLLRDVQWAIEHQLPHREIARMLEKLLGHAPRGSEPEFWGKSKLAELILEAEPWRAARIASDLLRTSENDRLWAVLGLAHTLLGNLRSAERAYRRALALNPQHPLYSHNLGHLLDAGLDRPKEALPLLKLAFKELQDEPEIAGSYAHALMRAGLLVEARRVLAIGLGGDEAAARAMLETWMNRKRADRSASEASAS